MNKLTRYRWMRKYAALAVACGLVACSGPAKPQELSSPPNVVIILADDLGYGDLSCFGQDEYATPNIDELAGLSVVCTDFYVPTPYCAPSRATLLTGRFPLRHGLIQNPTPDAGINDIGIKPEEVTLGERFRENGYQTMCIGKWHLGHKEAYFPVNHGFEKYYGILYSNDMRPVQIIENRDTVTYPVDQSLLTRTYTEKALNFITTEREAPFFLYLSHAMPHKPLAASKQFYTPETPDDLYADVMRELDWSVGEIMRKLRDLALLENTVVIFMSDNGPWYGGSTGGLKGMKATTWEGGIRVPFVIHYPKLLGKPRNIDTPCWSADIYPTLLSLAGIEKNAERELDGENITDILNGSSRAHSPIFSMHGDKIMSVRKGDWKLFVKRPPAFRPVDLSKWSDPRAPDGITIIAPYEQATPARYPGLKATASPGEIQLYNLREDPQESNDLSKDRLQVVTELLADYHTFKEDMK